MHYKVMVNVFRCLYLLCVARCCGVESTQYNYNPLPRCQAAARCVSVLCHGDGEEKQLGNGTNNKMVHSIQHSLQTLTTTSSNSQFSIETWLCVCVELFSVDMTTWRVYCGNNKQAVVLATPTLFTSDTHNNEISVRCHKFPGDLQSYNTTILQNKTNTNPICVQFAGSNIDVLYCVLCSMFFICQVSKYISSSPACQKWNIDQISFWRQTPSNVFQACANFSSDFLRRYRWRDARHPPSLLRFDECAAWQLAGGPRGAAARAGDTQ